MTTALVILVVLALVAIFCLKHFLVQVTALKLFFDATVILLITLRQANQSSEANQAVAWLFASTGSLIFFVLLAGEIRRSAALRSRTAELKYE